jgi:adenosylcobinamide-GDP ribazoletransferase
MTYIVTAFAFASLGGNQDILGLKLPLILPALITIELCAKLSMILVARAGRSVHKGMNSAFLEVMHGSGGNWRLALALIISLSVSLLLLGLDGIAVVLAAIATGLVMVAVAHKNFNGVTGDVFGATNELTRLVSSVLLLAVVAW